eukprot:g6282.t1
MNRPGQDDADRDPDVALIKELFHGPSARAQKTRVLLVVLYLKYLRFTERIAELKERNEDPATRTPPLSPSNSHAATLLRFGSTYTDLAATMRGHDRNYYYSYECGDIGCRTPGIDRRLPVRMDTRALQHDDGFLDFLFEKRASVASMSTILDTDNSEQPSSTSNLASLKRELDAELAEFVDDFVGSLEQEKVLTFSQEQRPGTGSGSFPPLFLGGEGENDVDLLGPPGGTSHVEDVNMSLDHFSPDENLTTGLSQDFGGLELVHFSGPNPMGSFPSGGSVANSTSLSHLELDALDVLGDMTMGRGGGNATSPSDSDVGRNTVRDGGAARLERENQLRELLRAKIAAVLEDAATQPLARGVQYEISLDFHVQDALGDWHSEYRNTKLRKELAQAFPLYRDTVKLVKAWTYFQNIHDVFSGAGAGLAYAVLVKDSFEWDWTGYAGYRYAGSTSSEEEDLEQLARDGEPSTSDLLNGHDFKSKSKSGTRTKMGVLENQEAAGDGTSTFISTTSTVTDYADSGPQQPDNKLLPEKAELDLMLAAGCGLSLSELPEKRNELPSRGDQWSAASKLQYWQTMRRGDEKGDHGLYAEALSGDKNLPLQTSLLKKQLVRFFDYLFVKGIMQKSWWDNTNGMVAYARYETEIDVDPADGVSLRVKYEPVVHEVEDGLDYHPWRDLDQSTSSQTVHYVPVVDRNSWYETVPEDWVHKLAHRDIRVEGRIGYRSANLGEYQHSARPGNRAGGAHVDPILLEFHTIEARDAFLRAYEYGYDALLHGSCAGGRSCAAAKGGQSSSSCRQERGRGSRVFHEEPGRLTYGLFTSTHTRPSVAREDEHYVHATSTVTTGRGQQTEGEIQIVTCDERAAANLDLVERAGG